MSTIPRNFFSGALPGRPATTSANGAGDARPLRAERIACARCVFAEHLNKGIFFAKHFRIARSAVAHRRTSKTSKRSASGRFGIHESPTTGSRIRHRTTPFAQKLRKLFQPASAVADACKTSMRMSVFAIRMRAGRFVIAVAGAAPCRETTNEGCRLPGLATMRAREFAGFARSSKRNALIAGLRNGDAGAERSGRHRVAAWNARAKRPGLDQWSSSSSNSA